MPTPRPTWARHPSDHIGPCLAVAEAEKASATEAITAIVRFERTEDLRSLLGRLTLPT